MLFKTHDVSFKRVFQIQMLEEKLCISSRLQLDVQREVRWFEPYLSEKPERWVIEGKVTEDIWNPEGISKEFDKNIVLTYRTIRSMFESKMEKDPRLPDLGTDYVNLIREDLGEVLTNKEKFNKVCRENLFPRSQEEKSTVVQDAPISPSNSQSFDVSSSSSPAGNNKDVLTKNMDCRLEEEKTFSLEEKNSIISIYKEAPVAKELGRLDNSLANATEDCSVGTVASIKRGF
jgi:hypothetical protein